MYNRCDKFGRKPVKKKSRENFPGDWLVTRFFMTLHIPPWACSAIFITWIFHCGVHFTSIFLFRYSALFYELYKTSEKQKPLESTAIRQRWQQQKHQRHHTRYLLERVFFLESVQKRKLNVQKTFTCKNKTTQKLYSNIYPSFSFFFLFRSDYDGKLRKK